MKPTDLAYLRIPTSPTITPDGGRVVVAVTRMDLDADAYTSQLWIASTTGTSEPRQITQGWLDTAPRVSPDGRMVAFLRAQREQKAGTQQPPQLHVMPIDGGEPRQVTTAEQHPLGVEAPSWSPDSQRVAYVARIPEEGRYGTAEGAGPEKEPPRRITTLKYRLDGVGFVTDRRPHVFVLDPHAETTEPVRITEGDYDTWDVTWSPDSSLLAFVSARHPDRDTTTSSDIFVCAPDGSGLRQLTDTSLEIVQPRFATDGTTLYFQGAALGADGKDFVARPPGLWRVPVRPGRAQDGTRPSSAPERLTDEESYGLSRLPTLPTVPTGDGVLCTDEHRGAIRLLHISSDGQPKPLVDGAREVTGFDSAAGMTVVTAADPRTAGELIALRDGKERVLTSFGDTLHAHSDVQPLSEIEATAMDGYPVHGWVVRPAGPGPHPVLLMIHGGPYAHYGWKLFDEAQVYAGAGYAVVMGNPRGSSGYGRAHGLAIRYDVGAVSQTDLLALLDHALEAPDLDSGRVGVLGGSHGGYMTTWLLAHTGRFRAGITERAVNAIDSMAGSSDIGSYFPDQYYGTDPAARAAQSPLTYADQITAPTLIIHSEQDWRCPLEQAQRLFVALKKQGVPTEMLIFPGEGHELSRSGLPSHRVARFDAILDWWDRHL